MTKEVDFDLVFCPVNQDCPNGPPYRIIFVERGHRGEHGYLDFRTRTELEQTLAKFGVLFATVEDGIMMMETGRICTVPNVQVDRAQAKKMGVLKRKPLSFPRPNTA